MCVPLNWCTEWGLGLTLIHTPFKDSHPPCLRQGQFFSASLPLEVEGSSPGLLWDMGRARGWYQFQESFQPYTMGRHEPE